MKASSTEVSNGSRIVSRVESLTSWMKRKPGRRVTPPCRSITQFSTVEPPSKNAARSGRPSINGDNSPFDKFVINGRASILEVAPPRQVIALVHLCRLLLSVNCEGHWHPRPHCHRK